MLYSPALAAVVCGVIGWRNCSYNAQLSCLFDFRVTRFQLERDRLGILQRGANNRPPMVASFFPVVGISVATQYEILFKLSIRTFHVSIMAINPAIASHRLRHPWW
jgi:hypothetical protein